MHPALALVCRVLSPCLLQVRKPAYYALSESIQGATAIENTRESIG